MANNPSRSRSKATERHEKKTFVFGSSTPRDLSYMNTMPATLRTYDSKVKPRSPRAKDETLAHYMRQARSVTRNQPGSREASGDRVTRAAFAFGSSTPRLLSHQYSITRDYADSRINPQVGRRSYTTPTLPTTRSKTVPAPVKIQVTQSTKIIRKPSGTEQKKVTTTTTTTTTRHVVSVNHKQPKEGSEEFMNSVKQKLETQKDAQKDKAKKVGKVLPKKKEENAGKTNEEARDHIEKSESPKKTEISPSESVQAGNESKNATSTGNNAEEPHLLESSVAEDEAKLLSVETTRAQNIVPEEITADNSVIKMTQVESLKDSGATQIEDDESSRGNTANSFHLESMRCADDSESAFVEKEQKQIEIKESDSEHKNELKEEILENAGSELSKSSTLTEPYSAVITSDPGISLAQSSPPPTPEKISASENRIPSENETEQKNEMEKDMMQFPEQESKAEIVEKKGEEHADQGMEQYRFPESSEFIPGNLQQGNSGTSEQQFHSSKSHHMEVSPDNSGGAHQIIYNYSYECRSVTPAGQEECAIGGEEESYRPKNEMKISERTYANEDPKKASPSSSSVDNVEGVSVL